MLKVFHGTTGSGILGILAEGGFNPGKTFFSGGLHSSFMHGADTSRGASFVIEVEVDVSGAESVKASATPGVPRTTTVTSGSKVPATITRMFVRRRDAEAEGGYVIEVIEGKDAIERYLRR
jgi:hypothetical protein